MNEKLTFHSLKTDFVGMSDTLIDDVIASVRLEKYKAATNQRAGEDDVNEYVLGSVWGRLLDRRNMIPYDSESSGALSAAAMEKACVAAGLALENKNRMLLIHLRNHDYGFYDQEYGAYGGPQDKSGNSSGGTSLNMAGDEFVQFLNSFDQLVPEILKYVASNIQDALKYLKSEEIMQAALEGALKKEIDKRSDKFGIEIHSCNPNERTVELWFDRFPQDGTVIMTVGYDCLIEEPERFLDLGCDAFEDPGIPEGHDFLPISLTSFSSKPKK